MIDWLQNRNTVLAFFSVVAISQIRPPGISQQKYTLFILIQNIFLTASVPGIWSRGSVPPFAAITRQDYFSLQSQIRRHADRH